MLYLHPSLDVKLSKLCEHHSMSFSLPESHTLCPCAPPQHVACDKEVGSYKQEDKCGVCAGDNSHCRTVKLTLTKTPKKTGETLLSPPHRSLLHVCVYNVHVYEFKCICAHVLVCMYVRI